jgi:hypothetical protein
MFICFLNKSAIPNAQHSARPRGHFVICTWRRRTFGEQRVLFVIPEPRPRHYKTPQRQRSQNLTSASGDAIWGAHRPNCIHGQFGVFFCCPPGTPGPPVHPRGNFYQTDFPPLSCSVLRGPALLRPHTSKRPRPGGPYSCWTPSAGARSSQAKTADLSGRAHSNWHKKRSRPGACTPTKRAARASPNLISSPTKSREVTK